jgi:Beta-lactamase enzyme family
MTTRPCVDARLIWLLVLALPLLMGADPRTVEQQLVKEAEAVPGRRAFLFAELTDKGPVPLYASGAKERFAIGSSFKLFILGALIDEVNHGKRRSEDIMLLRRNQIGPPASEMAEWPVGSPVTLHTYALKMIWISDNTATDHLLYLLGRSRVEEQLQAMGHSDPAVNRPLLSTREMVMVRDKKAAGRLEKWRKLDEAGKRKLLDGEIAGLHDFEAVDFDTAAFDAAEWYATPLDMANALNWLRRNTAQGQTGRPLLQVMAVDPKLKYDKKTWPFVGFKGGSEDQLLCGNWLMQHKNGKWYAFHLFFNNDKGKLNPDEALKVMQKMFAAIDAEVK